jgi:hypothetical protein
MSATLTPTDDPTPGPETDEIRIVEVSHNVSPDDVAKFAVWITENPTESYVGWAVGYGPVAYLSGDIYKGRAVLKVSAGHRSTFVEQVGQYRALMTIEGYAAAKLASAHDRWKHEWLEDDKPGAPREARPVSKLPAFDPWETAVICGIVASCAGAAFAGARLATRG